MSARAIGQLVRIGVRGRRRATTALFVVVVALAAAAFVAGLGSRRDAGTLWDATFARAHGPQVTLSATDPALLGRIASDPRVATASAPIAVNASVTLEHAGDDEQVMVRAVDQRQMPAVGAPYLVSGRHPIDAASEVTVEKSFAADFGISIGDTVSLRSGEIADTFAVVGLVLDFNDCFYPNCDPGVVWTNGASLDRLGSNGRFLQVFLELHDPSTAPQFVAAALHEHPDGIIGSQDWLDTRGDALALNDFFGAFLSGFGVFVLVAAGIVVAGSVTNRILARQRDIGLLKAVGATPAQVVAAITVEHLVLGLIAVALGWLLGSALVPSLRIGVTEVIEGPGVRLAVGSLATTVAIMAVIVAVATVLPAVRPARRTTSSALRPPTDPGTSARLGRLARRLGAGAVTVVALKDSLKRPLRTTLAGISMVLALVALIVTLGFRSTVDWITATPAIAGDPWDVEVTPRANADRDAITAAIAANPRVAGVFGEAGERRPVDGDVVLARALWGDPDDAHYVIRQGRNMTAPGEALAGYGLLERLGRRVGDTVTVEIDGREFPLSIVGRYSETEDSGDVLMFRAETIQVAFPEAAPTLYRVVAHRPGDRAVLARELQTALATTATAAALTIDTEANNTFAVAFWTVAGLVLVVALTNLGATVLLGVRERTRELGVLRAVGFTPAQVVRSTALSTALAVAVAVAVGVPLGLWLNQILLSSVGRAIGFGPELHRAPGFAVATLVVVLVVAAAVAIGALVSSGTSRRPVRELVAYE